LLDGLETVESKGDSSTSLPQASAMDSFPQGLGHDCCNKSASGGCGKLDATAAAAYRFATPT
jgi:hypothetical protein